MAGLTLKTALAYIRDLQPRVMDAGWCILLGGGVLNRGWSDHDVDLLAYPRTLLSSRETLLAILPPGTWSRVEVADIYSYEVKGARVELIFQTFVPDEQPIAAEHLREIS